MDWDKKWLDDFSAGKSQLVSCDYSINTAPIDTNMDAGIYASSFTNAHF